VENWTAMMAPAATPDAVVQKLSAEILKILASPDIEERARTQGFRVDARGADKFAPFLDDEIQRWGRIIKTARITAD
jgi:tripartite-type tricarboxylate transporter receptor subunit TctC